MITKIYTLIAISSFLASSILSAQLADGTIAPNFTVTDINGGTHTLYDYLDEGKTVVLDFSTTWCGPCWSYHESHRLEDIHEQYGPNGTDEMVVLWIEADSETTMDDLEGLTASSQGNWIEGVSYPIIQDLEDPDDDFSGTLVSNLYDIGYFPTIFYVCPNRIIQQDAWQDGYMSADQLYEAAQNCAVATAGVNVSNFEVTGFNTTCENQFDLDVTFQSLGEEPLTQVDITLLKDGNVIHSEEWSGSLSTFQTASIQITGIAASLLESEYQVVFFTDGDADTSNNNYTKTYSSAEFISGGIITLNIQADGYPEELGWELTDASGTILQSVEAGEITGDYSVDISLGEPSCHILKITDSWGDGLLSGGYTISNTNDGEVLLDVNYTDFNDDGNDHAFRNALSSGVASISEKIAEIYPTNTSDIVNINTFSALGSSIVQVYSLTGKLVINETVNASDFQLSLGAFSDGMYIINITNEGRSFSQKILLNK